MVCVWALAVLGLVAVLAAAGGVHWYVWRRMVRDTTRAGGWPRRAGTVAVVAFPLMSVGAMASTRLSAPFLLQQVLAWPGYLWMAFLLYLVMALVVGEFVRPLLKRVLRVRRTEPAPAPAPAPVPVAAGTGEPVEEEGPAGERADTAPVVDSSRRLFIARTVAVGAAAAAASTVGYGMYGVLRGPSVKHVTVPLAKLPRSAHGFRIAVVSDIHLGPILGRGHAQRVVDAVNSTNPDLITIVGDLVDGDVDDLGPAAAPLRELTARHGAFFVTGNHEYYSGAQQWVDYVRGLGIHPLENARVEMPGFDLAGVNDYQGESEHHGPDFRRALGDRDRTRASVLLAHQPVAIHDSVKFGVDLQLSGHSHGGQLWPGNYVAALDNPTVAGLERYGDTQLYVTRGAGAWGPPVRVGAPSDVTVVTLASRQA
ncbi:metallophosphoesterase [Yinghuangia seranimata]|uniref:metallophosphoesterase n=1 Tax=Yinghuangia seranimata TaxID=408067 RepID=UPI00248CF4FD|nr:metallophosphoesterase [Yinghuangia seranimata]MDI2129605.1 metallophosphoesterase [Yinghuangia seranimata]